VSSLIIRLYRHQTRRRVGGSESAGVLGYSPAEMEDFLATPPRGVDLRSAYARSARLALVGLVGPPALLGFASAGGYPLRSGVGIVTWLGAFAAGFGMGGAIAASASGIATSRLARTGAACALAGSAGGALALLPYAWSLLGLRFPGDTYLWMALAVMAFLGCIIVPFYWMGAIIARGIGDGAAVEKG